MSVLSPLLFSGLATFALWFLLTAGCFAAVGFWTGRVTRRFVPEGQEVVSRSVWAGGCLIAAIFVGSIAGLNVGGSQAMLAAGDSLSRGGKFVLISPLPERGEEGVEFFIRDGAEKMRESLEDEWVGVRSGRIVIYAVSQMVLGPLWDPAVTLFSLGRAYVAAEDDPSISRERLERSWDAARPDLSALAFRKMAMSVILGALYFVGLFLAGLAVLALSWRDLRRAASKDAPPSWRDDSGTWRDGG